MPETITNNRIKYLNGNPYIEYRLSLKYTNKYGVPLPEIADGLLALQTQVDFLPYSLNRTIKCKGIRGLKIEKSIVKLTKLESGSLIEDFIVMLFFKDKKNLERILGDVRDKYKLNVMTEKFIIPILIGAVAYFSLKSCSTSKNPETTINIDMSNNSGIIVSGSEAYGLRPDEYKKILSETYKTISSSKKRKLENSALDIIRPIQNNVGDLEVMNNASLTIKGSDIHNLPERSEINDSVEECQDYKNVQIFIRALDRDKADHGWSAIIPIISGARVKLVINSNTDLSDLATKESFYGDVVAVWTKKTFSKRRLKEYILISVYSPQVNAEK